MIVDLLGTVDFLGDFLLLIFTIMGIKYYVIEPWWEGKIKWERERYSLEHSEWPKPKKRGA